MFKVQNMNIFRVSIVNFEHIIVGWDHLLQSSMPS